MKILVTGATGFIGKALSVALHKSGFDLRVAIRKSGVEFPVICEVFQVGDVGPQTDWDKALSGADVVVHLAGMAHVRIGKDQLNLIHKVNVLGAEHLARMAVERGVRRFIFISSIKVNGEGSLQAYSENDLVQPVDAYGISKRETEDLLKRLAAETGLQVVILRVPLVYGPQVKANFKDLIQIAGSGLPFPFKRINNRRSFLYIGNLVDAIITCIDHSLAAGETFLVSDGQDISTPDLIKMIAGTMNKSVCLFSLPPAILRALCRIAGKTAELEKLTGSLFIDSSKIRNLLGWKPPFTFEEGIRETIRDFDRKQEVCV